MDRHSNEGFYVTLPSNASLNVFKDNKSSSFKVDLPQHIDLQGRWEVALTEISYPHTWFNLPHQHNYYDWREKTQEGTNEFKTQSLPVGYYENMEQLIIKMNVTLVLLKLGGYVNVDPLDKKVVIRGDGGYQLRFHKTLAHILGMEPGKWYTLGKNEDGSVHYPTDITAGFNHLFCYSDVVRHQLVGDVFAPLLRIVGIQGSFGDVITQTFNPAQYLPVSKNHIENITVEIKSDQNQTVNFTLGKTIAQLHFRPCRKTV